MFGLSELAILLIVVIAVLGARKLPELARSAGKSARILKAEARAAKDGQAAAMDGSTPRVVQGEVVPPGASRVSGTTPPAARADAPDHH